MGQVWSHPPVASAVTDSPFRTPANQQGSSRSKAWAHSTLQANPIFQPLMLLFAVPSTS